MAASSAAAVREPLAAPTTRHAVVVHPGALHVRAWDAVLAGLPADVGTTVVDLGQDRRYATAGIDPRTVAPSVDELADAVVDVLERERPAVLLGWSFGGVVAQAAVARPGVPAPQALVLLDSIAPVPELVMDDDFDRSLLREWFGMYLCAKQGVARPGRPVPLDGAGMCDWAVEAGAVRPGTPAVGLQKVFDAYLAGLHRNNELVRGHRARAHDVPTFLVRPTAGLLPERDLGWSRLHEATVTVPCAGDHYSMFDEPALRRLLDVLLPGTPAAADARPAQPSRPTRS